jgi:hypothetical protein
MFIFVAARSTARNVFARSTLGSWVRIPLKTQMFELILFSCVGIGLETD